MAPTPAELAERFLDLSKSNDWTKTPGTRDGMNSKWEKFYYPHESRPQGRWEGEIDELVVYGEIPSDISGTFYRIIIDPYMPPDERNGFVEGDGWPPTFGIYRNPYTNDPSTRYANDSTGNTNIIYWGGNVLALAERGLPWAIDPDTLETRRYDPFAGQVKALTFTAHAKWDPKTNELVTWGYEAKGLLTTAVVAYNLSEDGNASGVNWVHDGWITENWIILSGMPLVTASDEELRAGSQHWKYCHEIPQMMIVSPRRPETPCCPGWKVGEFRQYAVEEPGLTVHCGAAWEDKHGMIQMESQWSDLNPFYFWNPPNTPPTPVEGKYVRWSIGPNQPTDSKIMPTKEYLPWWNEFPTVDDRFNTQRQNITFMVGANVLRDEPALGLPPFNSGGQVAEPCFIPQPEVEGDGWLLFWTAREGAPRGEMILSDSNDFTKPVVVIQMPFVLQGQLHGNWVPNPNPSTKLPRLTKPLKYVQPTAIGPLNTI
ncbi:hypothetical protein EJ08DRAFT_700795 [Tothia fuscella]|uniref:Dioxygenase n=1 Tax=Tothia fuscella TaxID=1048955 RepID=A0A9P4NJX0_9PEZI|nr:hypothetical protein EJ08DRAFT_700795 [Tothia fuscella]